jgi:hypothetical protein
MIDELPFNGSNQKKYDWSEWFNGSAWELVRGEDFDTEPARFVNTARKKASMRGVRLATRTRHDRAYIQVIDTPDAQNERQGT